MTRWKSKMVLLFLFGSIFMAMAFSACDSTNPPVSPVAEVAPIPTNTPCTNPATGATCTFTSTNTVTSTPTVTATPTNTGTPCFSMGQTIMTTSRSIYGFPTYVYADIVACRYNLASNQTIHNLWIPVASNNFGRISAAIYGDSGLGYPGSLLIQSQPQPAIIGLNKLPVPATSLSAGKYWLAIQTEYYYTYFYYTNSGLTSDQYAFYTQTFGSFPPPGPNWVRTSGYLYSIIADSCP